MDVLPNLCFFHFLEGTKFDVERNLCYNYNRKKKKEKKKKSMATLDVKLDKPMVDHPSHYAGSIEAIDAIAAATAGLAGVEAFDTGNALKYLWRWKRKNGVEDLNKAVWYIQHLIKHLEEVDGTQPSLEKCITLTSTIVDVNKPITATDQLMRNIGADTSTTQANHDWRLT